MLRLPRLNPRRNPAVRWSESFSTSRDWRGITRENTDVMRIPQITITHPRLGSGPAGTGLFQAYVESEEVRRRQGARVDYLAHFNVLLPYEVAANPVNFQKLETTHVGFSRFILREHPTDLNYKAQRGLAEMSDVGDGKIADEYRSVEPNLVMFDDGSEFATLEEAKAWIQSKVDTLSRLTLERPSGH